MAKLTYTKDFGLAEPLGNHFITATAIGDNDSDTHLTYVGSESWQLKLNGENIDLETTIAKGTIESIVFSDEDGVKQAVIKGLHLPVSEISSYLEGEYGDFQQMFEAALSGKDDVVGTSRGEALYGYAGKDHISAGDGKDYICGGTGGDRLTGGKGADTFVFLTSNEGHDVITDFDADGGEGRQDLLRIDAGGVEIIRHGHDTLIRYGDGGEILLEGVDKSHIKIDDDFLFVP